MKGEGKSRIEREIAYRILMSIRKDKLEDAQVYYKMLFEIKPKDYIMFANVTDKYSDYMVRKYAKNKPLINEVKDNLDKKINLRCW